MSTATGFTQKQGSSSLPPSISRRPSLTRALDDSPLHLGAVMKIIRFLSSVSRRIIPRPPPIIIPVTPSPSLPPPEEQQAQASSSTAPPLPSKPGPKKRALLIGIQNLPPEKLALSAKAGKLKEKVAQKLGKQPAQEYDNDQGPLRGPHRDVRAMRQVLIGAYRPLL